MQVFRPRLCALAVVAASLLAATTAHAEFFGNVQGGTDFPQGIASFADKVVSYDPVINGSGHPTVENRVFGSATGAPDYVSGASDKSVTLGDGGAITLEFVDNRLTGSGDNKLDLWVFEVGPDVEDTFVEISKDGATWVAVGKVFGSTAGIDIDAYGFSTADEFRFVRLTDDPREGDQLGASVGADIDALGAIASISAPVPEPKSWAMLLLGLALLCSAPRRRGAVRVQP